MPAGSSERCAFCAIAARRSPGEIVFEDERALAFLDNRPLFPGHTLLIPRQHHETLEQLPRAEVGPFFELAQRLAVAVREAMSAEGSFVAMNNAVSQSVPHLHVHIVPRVKGDGLRGFFWPRRTYEDDGEMAAAAERIRSRLAEDGG